MKFRFSAVKAAVITAVALPMSAFATGPDYSKVADAVDATTIVTGITAVAGVMMLPRVAKWGYRQVMSFVR